ncbi:hypothetical protein DFH11DRAFT_1094843 [Phellopilus nigrolimitatus]|nr:hypothetical protein DFH11DRAFT_1094843 [Phellopilus nigrolimitatus]
MIVLLKFPILSVTLLNTLLVFALSAVAAGITSESQSGMAQAAFTSHESDLAQWQISLSKDWDVLGPFPIHAREQHFLSPGFPLNRMTVRLTHHGSASSQI